MINCVGTQLVVLIQITLKLRLCLCKCNLMRKFLYIIGFWSRQQWMLDGLHLEGCAAQQLSQLIYNANQILHIFKGERERERSLYTRFIIWKRYFLQGCEDDCPIQRINSNIAKASYEASQSNSNSSISLARLSFPSPLSRHIPARLTTVPQKDGMPGKSPRSAGCH